jgi:hypothetical protein
MRRLLPLAAGLGAVAGQYWPAEGGSSARTGATTTSLNLEAVIPVSAHVELSAGLACGANVQVIPELSAAISLQRPLYNHALRVGGSVAFDLLLQSPLVTASGNVVLVADNMTVWVMPDPANMTAGEWAPLVEFPSSAYAPLPGADPADFVHSGSILDTDGMLYILDGRNRALRALFVSFDAVTETVGSPLYFNRSQLFTIQGTASLTMVPDAASGNQLWIPLSSSLEGTDGTAYVVPVCMFKGCAYGPVAVPLPEGCAYPSDLGSATIIARNPMTGVPQPAVVTLGSESCGMQVNSAGLSTGAVEHVWSPPCGSYLFDREKHPHPTFDAATNSLLFVDFSMRDGAPQRLCCRSTLAFFGWWVILSGRARQRSKD